MNLKEFYEEFNEQVLLAEDEKTERWNREDYFTAVMLDYLCEP